MRRIISNGGLAKWKKGNLANQAPKLGDHHFGNRCSLLHVEGNFVLCFVYSQIHWKCRLHMAYFKHLVDDGKIFTKNRGSPP